MLQPPNIPADVVPRIEAMPGRVILEMVPHRTLRQRTGTTLALPTLSERQTRRETLGEVLSVGDGVNGLAAGDVVYFRKHRPDIGQSRAEGVRTFTSGSRRFVEAAAANCYAATE